MTKAKEKKVDLPALAQNYERAKLSYEKCQRTDHPEYQKLRAWLEQYHLQNPKE